MAAHVYMDIDTVLANYAPGSFDDWTWDQEFEDLWSGIRDEDGYMDNFLAYVEENGIKEPIHLGPDGRVWDGHHRLAIAKRLGILDVPVEKVS